MRDLVEGETAYVDVTLYDGEGASRTAVVGTGLTIGMVLRDCAGALIPTTGNVAWLVAADGTVRYSPASTDLKAARSPYEVRFSVTDGSGRVAYYPNGHADKWDVRK